MFKIVNWIFLIMLLALIGADQWIHISGWFYALLCATYIGIQVYGSSVLSAEYYLPVAWRGNSSSGAVALTFDDGPVAGRTDKILEILHQHNAPAAFFCIGKRVHAHPQLVHRMHGEGHLVANHSYFHGATFDLQSSAAISKELSDAGKAIEQAIGLNPSYFRPPYGVTNPMVASAVRKGKYKTIGWSVRSFDTVIKDRNRLLARITGSLKSGDIILLHDHGHCTLEILPDLLASVSALGLKIVRVDKLLNDELYVQR
ncbi:polysaccharide deacetylase family protein [Chryseolinea sp. T2]|uniref:polysaccharide deacetylase family protein n=1 Tax=Chryseolinea sp. T2 TaxID=3129255 RepID=UPI00307757DC